MSSKAYVYCFILYIIELIKVINILFVLHSFECFQQGIEIIVQAYVFVREYQDN